THGGARKGAGSPKTKEDTVVIRIPVCVVDKVKMLINGDSNDIRGHVEHSESTNLKKHKQGKVKLSKTTNLSTGTNKETYFEHRNICLIKVLSLASILIVTSCREGA